MLARSPTRKPGFARSGRAPAPASAARVVPFDYSARFELTGIPGRAVSAVVNVEPDAVFVATAISYGLEADRTAPIALLVGEDRELNPATMTLGRIPPAALVEGFRVNPRSENLFFRNDLEVSGRARAARPLSAEPLSQALGDKLLERILPERPFSFLFSMIDSTTGRELQDAPTHSLASLGRSDGQRPFRPLAPPVSFMPRSTVRLQVVERTPGAVGTLHVVLSGYQVLVGRDAPTAAPPLPDLRGAGAAPGRVVPFDYIARLRLLGRPRNVVEQDVTVDSDGTFVATAVGYGLDPAALVAAPQLEDQASTVDLLDLPLARFSSDALSQGLRIRPDFLRFAFDRGALVRKVPRALARDLFEILNAPEAVSFRYGLLDTSSGRSWQNQLIHNTAGLGSADGVRPFKRLARPVSFGPRTTVRVTVEEGSGRGELHVALHGFKVLERARGGRP